VPYELKPRDVERRKITCELLFQRRKSFLHRIVTSDKKWICYDNPKRKKLWCKLDEPSISNGKYSCAKLMLCIFGISWVYYELFQPNETITGVTNNN